MFPYPLVLLRDLIYKMNKNQFFTFTLNLKSFKSTLTLKSIKIIFKKLISYSFHLKWYYIFRFIQNKIIMPDIGYDKISILTNSILINKLIFKYQYSSIFSSIFYGCLKAFFSFFSLNLFLLCYCMKKLAYDGFVTAGPAFIGFCFGYIFYICLFIFAIYFGKSSSFLFLSIYFERTYLLILPLFSYYIGFKILTENAVSFVLQQRIEKIRFSLDRKLVNDYIPYINPLQELPKKFNTFKSFLFPLKVHFLSKKTYISGSFYLGFVIALFEQPQIFHYITNITPSLSPTLLEFFVENSFFVLLSYYFFLFLFYFIALYLLFFKRRATLVKNIKSSFIYRRRKRSKFFNKENILKAYSIYANHIKYYRYIGAIGLMAMGCIFFASYPVEYSILGPLGFVAKDNLLYNTYFDPYVIRDPSAVLGDRIPDQDAVAIKLHSFDRGRYTLSSNKVPVSKPFSIENFVYRPDTTVYRPYNIVGIIERVLENIPDDLKDWFTSSTYNPSSVLETGRNDLLSTVNIRNKKQRILAIKSIPYYIRRVLGYSDKNFKLRGNLKKKRYTLIQRNKYKSLRGFNKINLKQRILKKANFLWHIENDHIHVGFNPLIPEKVRTISRFHNWYMLPFSEDTRPITATIDMDYSKELEQIDHVGAVYANDNLDRREDEGLPLFLVSEIEQDPDIARIKNENIYKLMLDDSLKSPRLAYLMRPQLATPVASQAEIYRTKYIAPESPESPRKSGSKIPGKLSSPFRSQMAATLAVHAEKALNKKKEERLKYGGAKLNINAKLQYYWNVINIDADPFDEEKEGKVYPNINNKYNYRDESPRHYFSSIVRDHRIEIRKLAFQDLQDNIILLKPQYISFLLKYKRTYNFFMSLLFKFIYRYSFLKKLSPNQEIDIYYKKLYYLQFLNALRKYKFRTKINESVNSRINAAIFKNICKSFSNKFYNHQFKGTLSRARRYHPITQNKYYRYPSDKLKSLKGPSMKTLKYDNLVYIDDKKKPQFHRELFNKVDRKNKDISMYRASAIAKNTVFMLGRRIKERFVQFKPEEDIVFEDKEKIFVPKLILYKENPKKPYRRYKTKPRRRRRRRRYDNWMNWKTSTKSRVKKNNSSGIKISPFFERIDTHPLSLIGKRIRFSKNKNYFLTQKELNVEDNVQQINKYPSWPLTSGKIEKFYEAFQGPAIRKYLFIELLDRYQKIFLWEPSTLQLNCKTICTELYNLTDSKYFDTNNDTRLFFNLLDIYSDTHKVSFSKSLDSIKRRFDRASKVEENAVRYLALRELRRRFVPTYIQNLLAFRFFHFRPDSGKDLYIIPTGIYYHINKPTVGGFYWKGRDLKIRFNVELRNFFLRILSYLVITEKFKKKRDFEMPSEKVIKSNLNLTREKVLTHLYDIPSNVKNNLQPRLFIQTKNNINKPQITRFNSKIFNDINKNKSTKSSKVKSTKSSKVKSTKSSKVKSTKSSKVKSAKSSKLKSTKPVKSSKVKSTKPAKSSKLKSSKLKSSESTR